MLIFDPRNPFPLPEGATYLQAQIHSEQVDTWLGFHISSIESKLKELPDQRIWVSLPAQAMLTPYSEIREILERLRPSPGTRIIDLGAGYGRMGFVIGRHFPQVHFVGYECVRERVEEAYRCLRPWKYSLVEMQQADLADPHFTPARAEYYFLYDFGTRQAIEKSLQDLRKIALQQSITVVGRGRASRDAIERQHFWLSQVVEPEHYANYSIYRTRPCV